MYKIYRIGTEQTLCFAARELAKYLTLITEEDCFEIEEASTYSEDKEGIWLGLDTDFNTVIEVENRRLDDGIVIHIEKGNGFIAGSNERSVLIGIYRFLTKLGCAFIRPGKDGEVLVKRQMNEMSVQIKETASYRHRGVVIEGANSYENVLDMIEWMPKVGYNSYFIQFMHAYSFFKQWYAHSHNPLKKPEFFNDEMAAIFTEDLTKEIKRRGLIFHAVGHGWTCEALGIPGRGWGREEHNLSEEMKECLALIKGERKFYYDVPLNTNLCYSNPKVQQLFVEKVVSYAKAHKSVDMLHVWVADDLNNHCECESCRTLTPTDWYVQILNQIDERLTQEGIDTQIVFLLYFELLWTPIQERLNNKDRFLMMFAPISRTFVTSYDEVKTEEEVIEPFELNKIKLPSSVTKYIQFLKEWQQVFKGDSFDFDYHLGRAHYGDAGYYKIAEVIYKDVRHLKHLGLNGLLSCQQQRTFFPTALPNYVMGRTLWNDELLFEDLVEEYFSNAFGENYKACIDYLQKVSDVFDMDYWHIQRGGINLDFAGKVLKAYDIVEEFEKVVAQNQEHTSKVEALSWAYIKYHLEYTKLFAKALSAKARGEEEKANEYWGEFTNYICTHEDILQPALDVFRISMIGKIFMKLG
nr:DUF4838 domain-containing protein [uncultured Niameybacter sp.]